VALLGGEGNTNLSYVGAQLRATTLSACLVGSDGRILEVSEGWKSAAADGLLNDRSARIGYVCIECWLCEDARVEDQTLDPTWLLDLRLFEDHCSDR
jgi:hypothetical protein